MHHAHTMTQNDSTETVVQITNMSYFKYQNILRIIIYISVI